MHPLALLLAVLAVVSGCASSYDEAAELPRLDEPYFRCHVQPVMAKSCASFACHGDTKRFLRVFARNRLRYALPEEKRNALLQPVELTHNLDSARAYVDLRSPEHSLLLEKPLDIAGGGAFHGGANEYDKGDVMLTRDDPDYQTLLAWVRGEKEDQACVEPGSNL